MPVAHGGPWPGPRRAPPRAPARLIAEASNEPLSPEEAERLSAMIENRRRARGSREAAMSVSRLLRSQRLAKKAATRNEGLAYDEALRQAHEGIRYEDRVMVFLDQ